MRRALAGLLCAAAGCIAPSVLESSGRAPVVEPPAALAWHAALPADLSGLFESVSVEGESAASLWKVYYHFTPAGDAGGTYSGAALVIGEAGPGFQTLSGAWSLRDGALDLGDGQPVRASAAPGHLRLESGAGSAVLRSVVLQ